ncbi:TetR family transcriptional regulator [Bacillus sp. FJAT-45037]|uniref:TetR family transcriptional regulator n=1 Tax=Bacillus sp. FJAT-45037 TaxID=2011007 RepID=UPI000C24E04C|nr:TetR family transcriptional regulator [Bacillus sp. FJAT-45037]
MNKNQEKKYQLILDAAFDQMKEKGFDKASISQIVKHAGVAQGTFYLYFDSKGAIVPAIAERILEEQLIVVKEQVKSGDSIERIIEVLIEQTFQLTDRHQEVIKFCYSGIAYYDSFQRWEDIYRPYYKWLEQKLEEAMGQNEIPRRDSVAHQASFIIGLIEQSAETFYLTDEPKGDMETVAYKHDLYEFIKRAIS